MCGIHSDAALANLGSTAGQAAAIEVAISAPNGDCERAGASVRHRAGRAIASVTLPCPTH